MDRIPRQRRLVSWEWMKFFELDVLSGRATRQPVTSHKQISCKTKARLDVSHLFTESLSTDAPAEALCMLSGKAVQNDTHITSWQKFVERADVLKVPFQHHTGTLHRQGQWVQLHTFRWYNWLRASISCNHCMIQHPRTDTLLVQR